MNLLVVLSLAGGALGLIWAGQSLVLWWLGEPLAWPLRFDSPHPAVRRTVRILVPSAWGLIVLLAPIFLGATPSAYYRPMLEPPQWPLLAGAVAYVGCGFALLHAIGRALGYCVPFREHDPRRLRGKLLRRLFVIPVPAALIEELVFRGVVLEQLRVALSGAPGGTLAALVLSSAVFSSVHFVAPKPPGESVAQAAAGLFFVGLAIGAGYLRGGLCLSVAIHAAGIACVEVPRLLVRFEPRGRWLVGSREFPHSGAFGIAAMTLLAGWLLRSR